MDDSPPQIWRKLVSEKDRFSSVSTEELFGRLSIEQLPYMKDWLDYIQARYQWVNRPKTLY
jgi:hypothetical protein